MNSCQNERNIEMGYYPIVEIKMVLRQPDYIGFGIGSILHSSASTF